MVSVDQTTGSLQGSPADPGNRSWVDQSRCIETSVSLNVGLPFGIGVDVRLPKARKGGTPFMSWSSITMLFYSVQSFSNRTSFVVGLLVCLIGLTCGGLPSEAAAAIGTARFLPISASPPAKGGQVIPRINPFQPAGEQDDSEDEEEPELALNSRAFNRPDKTTYIPAPRELTRPLIRAKRAIGENDPTRAAELIGSFLIDSPPEDYLVAGDSTDGTATSLRWVAEKMLAQLPDEALKSYRVRFGIPAQHQLEQAIETNDMSQIAEVSMRYFFTDAGQTASMLLGHYELDRGNPVSAAARFRRIYQYPPARKKFDPELSVLLATSLAMAGQETQATSTLTELHQRAPDAALEFEGRSISLFQTDAQAFAWLTDLIGTTQLTKDLKVESWKMDGGSPQRNARLEAGLPFQQPVWSVKLSKPKSKVRSLVVNQSNMFASAFSRPTTTTLLPFYQARTYGNTVIVSSLDETIGLDFETGKRIWTLPAPDPSGVTDSLSPTGGVSLRSFGQASQVLVPPRGRSVVDQGTLFLIPQRISTPAIDPRLGIYSLPTSNEQLVAASLSMQGKLLWSVGGKAKPVYEEVLDPFASQLNPVSDGEESSDETLPELKQPFLDVASFMGAPLVLGDEVFAICQAQHAIQLAVIDRDTGELKWKQHLASNEIGNSRYRPRMQRQVLSPSYAKGVLLCPTGTGALIAIDVSTRTMLWGYQYNQPTKSYSSPSSSWAKSRFIVDDNQVVFAASDSARLYNVNLETGMPNEKFGKLGVDSMKARYLACVEDGNAILVANDKVIAISTTDRSTVWTCSIKDFGKPTGEGFAAEGSYFLPTDDRYVLQIDLASGKILDSVETDETLGNLVSYRGMVLSSTADQLTCFETDVAAERQINKALAEVNSSDELPTRIQILRARLFSRQKQWTRAWQALENANLQEVSTSHQLERLGLIERMLDHDVEGSAEIAEKHWSSFRESDQAKLYPALVDHLIRAKRSSEAAEKLIDWTNQQASHGLFTRPDAVLELTDGFSVEQRFSSYDRAEIKLENYVVRDRDTIRMSKDQWLRSKLANIMQNSPAAVETIRTMVRKDLDARTFASSVEAFKYLQRFPAKAIPIDLKSNVVLQLLQDRRFNRAKSMLLSSIGFDPGRLTSGNSTEQSIEEALLNLWVQYAIESNCFDAANHVMDLVEDQQLQVVDSSGETQTQVPLLEKWRAMIQGSKEKREAKIVETVNGEIDWPAFNRSAAVHTTTNKYNTNLAADVKVQDSSFSPYRDLSVHCLATSKEVVFTDRYGRPTSRLSYKSAISSNSRYQGTMEYDDNLAVFSRSNHIVVCDMSKLGSGDNPVLWEQKLLTSATPYRSTQSNPMNEISVTRLRQTSEPGRFGVSVNGICVIQNRRLCCLDPFTGQTRWSRPIGSRVPALLANERIAVLVDFALRQAEVFEVATGRRTKVIGLPERMGTLWDKVGAKLLSTAVIPEKRLKEIESGQAEQKGILSRTSTSKGPNRMVVGLYNFETETYDWTKNVLSGSKMTRMSRRRLAVFPKTGNLKIYDLVTGQKLQHLELGFSAEKVQKVAGIGSCKVGDHDCVVFNESTPSLSSIAGSDGIMLQRVMNYEVLLNGTFLLLDAKTMKPVWRRPANLLGVSMMSLVPSGSPLMFVHRRVYRSSSSKLPAIARSHHIIGIDIETGEERVSYLYQNYSIQPAGAMICNPEEGSLSFDFGRELVSINLSQKADVPPMPVATITRNNSIPQTFDAEVKPKFMPEVVDRSIKRLREQARESEKKMKMLRETERRLLQKEFGLKNQ